VAAGIGWSGISANATDGDIQKWVSSGLKVLIWTVNRRSERDAKLKLGVAGFFSDDPTYVSSKLPLSAKDRFAAGTWAPGMFGNSGDFDLASRGEFFDGGYWGYSSTTPGYLGCLHGYLCPIKGTEAAKAYDISLTIRFDSATNNDPSRWASLFIGVDDRAFFDGAEVTNGYHILFRKNGSVEVFKKSAGARAALLVAASGTYIEDGRDASYRVTVTDATVKVARLGADGVELYAANARDVSYRGAYVHFGRNGLACRFNQITIS
jgi:hypothetical protein